MLLRALGRQVGPGLVGAATEPPGSRGLVGASRQLGRDQGIPAELLQSLHVHGNFKSIV